MSIDWKVNPDAEPQDGGDFLYDLFYNGYIYDLFLEGRIDAETVLSDPAHSRLLGKAESLLNRC